MAHRIKNGDIIVKFKDRISYDLVYNNELKLEKKTTKDLGFTEESSIFINESLSLDNKNSSTTFEIKAECLAIIK